MTINFDPTEQCRVSDCVWTYGKYGLKSSGKKGNWSVWWFDSGKPDRDRQSLFTTEFEVAKRKVIARAHGTQPTHPGGDPPLAYVIGEYLKSLPEGSDKGTMKTLSRMFFRNGHNDEIGNCPLSYFTEEEQLEALRRLANLNGLKANSLNSVMWLMSRAIHWATRVRRGTRLAAPFEHELLTNAYVIAEKLKIAKPKKQIYHPTPDQMAQLIVLLSHHEDARRWLVLMLAFGCRVEAACKASTDGLEGQELDLDPEGTAPNNKARPKLPVAPSAMREINSWGEGRWVGIGPYRIGALIRQARQELGLPKLKPRSIRHYVATASGTAHKKLDVPVVLEQEIARWQAHIVVSRTHDGYGSRSVHAAMVATEAMLRKLNEQSNGALLRQGPDRTPLDVLSAQGELEENTVSVITVPTEGTDIEIPVYLGPKRTAEGAQRPIEGWFRQVSDKVDDQSLTEMLDAMGIQIVEAERNGAAATRPPELYVVASNKNAIPIAAAGQLHLFAKLQSRRSYASSGQSDARSGSMGSEEIRTAPQDQFDPDMFKAEGCYVMAFGRSGMFTGQISRVAGLLRRFKPVLTGPRLILDELALQGVPILVPSWHRNDETAHPRRLPAFVFILVKELPDHCVTPAEKSRDAINALLRRDQPPREGAAGAARAALS
ncbi:hypothetical protein JNW90_21190 [Micromonospora sp. STR1s_5]|nr:hypothetical protein [Micromonospora sp. STR1s_5]